MRRYYVLAPVLSIIFLASCGSSGNPASNNVGLFGNWNVTMYPTNSQTPTYVFGLAMSQEGTSTYSGSSITYTGAISPPTNMCINANTMRASATVNSNSQFTITYTDISSNTVITVNGTLVSTSTTVTGNYSNAASSACPASTGTMQMVPQ